MRSIATAAALPMKYRYHDEDHDTEPPWWQGPLVLAVFLLILAAAVHFVTGGPPS